VFLTPANEAGVLVLAVLALAAGRALQVDAEAIREREPSHLQ